MLVRRNAEGEEEQEGEAEEHRRAASWLRARGELGVAPFWRVPPTMLRDIDAPEPVAGVTTND